MTIQRFWNSLRKTRQWTVCQNTGQVPISEPSDLNAGSVKGRIVLDLANAIPGVAGIRQ